MQLKLDVTVWEKDEPTPGALPLTPQNVATWLRSDLRPSRRARPGRQPPCPIPPGIPATFPYARSEAR